MTPVPPVTFTSTSTTGSGSRSRQPSAERAEVRLLDDHTGLCDRGGDRGVGMTPAAVFACVSPSQPTAGGDGAKAFVQPDNINEPADCSSRSMPNAEAAGLLPRCLGGLSGSPEHVLMSRADSVPPRGHGVDSRAVDHGVVNADVVPVAFLSCRTSRHRPDPSATEEGEQDRYGSATLLLESGSASSHHERSPRQESRGMTEDTISGSPVQDPGSVHVDGTSSRKGLSSVPEKRLDEDTGLDCIPLAKRRFLFCPDRGAMHCSAVAGDARADICLRVWTASLGTGCSGLFDRNPRRQSSSRSTAR